MSTTGVGAAVSASSTVAPNAGIVIATVVAIILFALLGWLLGRWLRS